MAPLYNWLWASETKPIEPKSNSLSSKEEKLAEYREIVLDQKKQLMINRRNDPLITWKPAAWDPRFPVYDVTNWCVTSYEDHFRCRYLRGDDYEPCNFFKNVYKQVCPQYMIDKWDKARANGTFMTIPPHASVPSQWKSD